MVAAQAQARHTGVMDDPTADLAAVCHRWHLESTGALSDPTADRVAAAARLTIIEQRDRCAALDADRRRHIAAVRLHEQAARATVAAADGRLDLGPDT